jgi:hypothetical protein
LARGKAGRLAREMARERARASASFRTKPSIANTAGVGATGDARTADALAVEEQRFLEPSLNGRQEIQKVQAVLAELVVQVANVLELAEDSLVTAVRGVGRVIRVGRVGWVRGGGGPGQLGLWTRRRFHIA